MKWNKNNRLSNSNDLINVRMYKDTDSSSKDCFWYWEIVVDWNRTMFESIGGFDTKEKCQKSAEKEFIKLKNIINKMGK